MEKKDFMMAIQSPLPREIMFHKARIIDKKQTYRDNYILLTKSSGNNANLIDTSKNNEIDEEDPLLREPKFYIYPKGKIYDLMSNSKDMIKKIGSGLVNMGNTCFLNSTLQCLMYAPLLNHHLLSREHSQSCTMIGFCSMCEMERLAIETSQSKRPVAPKKIISNLKKISKLLRFGRQEDSHEFLRCLLDNMLQATHHEHKKLEQREIDTSFISQCFGGYLQSQVKCSNCNYESNKVDPYMDINLEIVGSTLQDSFKAFTKPEILDNSNKYKCSSCKQETRAKKQLTIYTLPPILTISFKRFNLFGNKVNKKLAYPTSIDLKPYISPNSKIAGKEKKYELFGVLVHAGPTTNCGHYYSYVKSFGGGWYCMDDDDVTASSLSQRVLNEKPYLLFYKCVDEVKPSGLNSNGIPPVLNGKMAKKDIQDIEDIFNKKNNEEISNELSPRPPSSESETEEGSKQNKKAEKKKKKKNKKDKKEKKDSSTTTSDSSTATNTTSTSPLIALTSRKWFTKSDPKESLMKKPLNKIVDSKSFETVKNRMRMSNHPAFRNKSSENWENTKSSNLQLKSSIESQMRQERVVRGKILDSYDREIDLGKVKKERKRKEFNSNPENSFQNVENKKRRTDGPSFGGNNNNRRFAKPKATDYKRFRRAMNRWNKKN